MMYNLGMNRAERRRVKKYINSQTGEIAEFPYVPGWPWVKIQGTTVNVNDKGQREMITRVSRGLTIKLTEIKPEDMDK